MTTPLDRLREVVAQAQASPTEWEMTADAECAGLVLVRFLTSDGAAEAIAQALVDEEWEGTQPDFAHKPPSWKARYMARATAILSLLASKALGGMTSP